MGSILLTLFSLICLQTIHASEQHHKLEIVDLNIVENQPFVSVITASYNRVRYLELAIQSVQAQTYQNWELIIVDDGSHKQEAIDVLLKYPLLDSRVKVFFLNSNYGEPTVARNLAIHHSKGEYLAIFDDDDIMYPERLMKSVEFMLMNPQIDVVSGKMKLINEEGNVFATYFSKQMKHEEIKLRLSFMNYISHSTVMIRMNEQNRPNIYYNMMSAEDYDLLLRMLYEHNMRFEVIDEFMTYYRQHSQAARKEEKLNRDYSWIPYRLYEYYPKVFGHLQDGGRYRDEDYNDMNCMMIENFQKRCLQSKDRFIITLANFYSYYKSVKDYKMIKLFKEAMIQVARMTLDDMAEGSKIDKISFSNLEIEEDFSELDCPANLDHEKLRQQFEQMGENFRNTNQLKYQKYFEMNDIIDNKTVLVLDQQQDHYSQDNQGMEAITLESAHSHSDANYNNQEYQGPMNKFNNLPQNDFIKPQISIDEVLLQQQQNQQSRESRMQQPREKRIKDLWSSIYEVKGQKMNERAGKLKNINPQQRQNGENDMEITQWS
eukprot:403341546